MGLQNKKLFFIFSAPFKVSLSFSDTFSSEMPSISLYHVSFFHKVKKKIQENHIEDVAEAINLCTKTSK